MRLVRVTKEVAQEAGGLSEVARLDMVDERQDPKPPFVWASPQEHMGHSANVMASHRL